MCPTRLSGEHLPHDYPEAVHITHEALAAHSRVHLSLVGLREPAAVAGRSELHGGAAEFQHLRRGERRKKGAAAVVSAAAVAGNPLG